ncbi:MAG: DUF86 domain-containing protein [Thermoleophilia bacterium]
MTPEDRDRLEHIAEAIDRITDYAAAGEAVFMSETMRQDAVIRNLEILGGAAGRLSTELRARHDEVPWSALVAHRNVLIHDYRRLVLGLVWRVVTEDIGPLRSAVASILEGDT